MRYLNLIVIAVALFLSSCESAYYGAMEKVGIHKREILVDRIEETQEASEDAQEQFADALEQFRSVVQFDGGDIEVQYNKLKGEYEDSESAVETIRNRIDSVENVAEALFEEWEEEIQQYTSQSLKRSSQEKLRTTKSQYNKLLRLMKEAERSTKPVLDALRDNMLYMKHNLNARAIASLKGELRTIDNDVDVLIKRMQTVIKESDKFIKNMNN